MITMEENFMKAQQAQTQKIEDSVANAYDRIVKEESDKQQAEVESAAAQRFEEVRRLGFATKKDIEEFVAAQKEKSDTEQLRRDFTELREFVLRAKARGLNTGKNEEDVAQPDGVMKAWERPFYKDFKK